ncbi:hypothetical protein [Desulfovulcanus sp.]
MARKDQVKLFACACLDEEPFVAMMRDARLKINHWAYINAIRKWRDKIRDLVLAGLPFPEKQLKSAINKAASVFRKASHEAISVELYINFCLALTEDIYTRVRNKTEKHVWGKIIENLFKLYLCFDPALEADKAMEGAVKLNEHVYEFF